MALETLERFFDAFARRDGERMAECYHPAATFYDPVFGTLEGERVGAMWQMLTRAADGMELTICDLEGDVRSGSARWVAVYPFGGTGRLVRNEVTSQFEFREGLIVRQTDSFAFYRWCRQALGPVGVLFGWTPVFRRRVRLLAISQLDRSMR